MRYAAIFASAANRAAATAWLAGVFGDDAARATANLAVPLAGPGGAAWFGGCAAVDDATAAILTAGLGGATTAVSDALDEDDPGAPARWWLARAADEGLSRPAAPAPD